MYTYIYIYIYIYIYTHTHMKKDFLKNMREMKLWFLKQGYPENIVDQELGKVEFSESS